MADTRDDNLDIRIDPQFRSLIPDLRPEECQLLEHSLLTEGCRNSLVVWQDNGHRILLDGHHRLDICRNHKIPFPIKTLGHDLIPNREAAEDWIECNQLARRNLTPEQFTLLLGRRYNRLKKPQGGARTSTGQNDHLNTAHTLAEQHGVSEVTVRRAGKFAESVARLKEADPSIEQKISRGERPSRAAIIKAAKACHQPDKDAKPPTCDNPQGASPAAHARLDALFSSATAEWNTPATIIEPVLRVLGTIDIDPCSNSNVNPNIPAKLQYTKQDDGLAQPWQGRVYMNPPYGRDIAAWVERLHDTYQAGQVSEAIALLPARTDTQWFRFLRSYPRCFVTGRLRFSDSDNAAPFPSMVVYLGTNAQAFLKEFSRVGDIYQLVPLSTA
ncbi:MAG TPA: DNA N-6-adenine-methyltransferase [Sedimentisphaerales bacterium]|nr:DNA N-6-adenine-methyltransferase [Sedimentisphaerales bacterium]